MHHRAYAHTGTYRTTPQSLPCTRHDQSAPVKSMLLHSLYTLSGKKWTPQHILITPPNKIGLSQNSASTMQHLTANNSPIILKFACNSSRPFKEVTQKHKTVHYWQLQTRDCQILRACKYQTCLKFMFKMSSIWSNASSKTWTSLLNSSFLLTVRFHPLPCFLSTVPSVSIFCNNLFHCPRLVVKFRWDFFYHRVLLYDCIN